MSTIEEAMAQALAAETNASEEWTKIEKYTTKEYYADSDITIDMQRRTIGDISENVSTVGEDNSQYVSFIMDRYVDGVDLVDMVIQIQCDVDEHTSLVDGPVNVYCNESKIRFGWAIPEGVTQISKQVKIMVFCTGLLPNGDPYTIKTKPLLYTIEDTLRAGGSIPQPDENWYLQFVTAMDQKVVDAAYSASMADQSATEANESLEAVRDIQSDVNQSKNTVQTLAAQVQGNTTKAQASAAAAKVSEQNAKASEDKAKMYADNASAVTEVQIAKQDIAGLVKGGDIYIAEDGTIELTRITTDRELKNSHPGGLKINSITGAPTQQGSTTGAQLFNIDDKNAFSGNATVDEDGWITVPIDNSTGTTEKYIPVLTPVSDLLLPSTDYGIVCEIANIENCYVLPTNNAGTANKGQFGTNKSVSVAGTHVYTATTRESFDDCTTMLRTYVTAKAGMSGTAKFRISVLADTSITADTFKYEKFTGGAPSPSTEYPQEIKKTVVKKLKVIGKNHFDKSSPMKGGTTFNEAGQEESVGDSNWGIFEKYMSVTPNTEYTLTGTLVPINWQCRFVEYDAKFNPILRTMFRPNAGKTYLFTTSESTRYVRFNYYNGDGELLLDTIQLEAGKVSTGIVPYTEKEIELSKAIELYNIGGVADRIVKSDGVYEVDRLVGEFKLPATFSINPQGRFYIVPSLPTLFTGVDTTDATYSLGYLCTHFISDYDGFAEGDDGQIQLYIRKDDNGQRIFIVDSSFATAEELNEWLGSNEVHLYYLLSNLVVSALPEADQIALRSLPTYVTVTYVSTDSELEPIIEVEHGTSRVGAYTLECYNDKEVMKLEIAAMKAVQETEEVVE